MSIADKKTKLKKLKENVKNPKLKEYWEMFEKGIAKLEKEIGADAKKGEDILDKAFSDKPKPKAKPKAKAKAKPKAKKKTSVSKADAEKELAKKVGKTEEECEDILKKFRELRAKKKARTKKTSETKAKSKAQGKTEPSGEITPEAVIKDATKKVEKKIDKKIEKVEAQAEKTEKPKADATPKAKKEAEKKVEKKVEKQTKVVANDSVDALEGMVKAIMDSLKKYDKATAKLSLIKLRDAIDKEIAKYGDGGMVQGFDIQASLINVGNNPSYAKGGKIEKELEGFQGMYEYAIENNFTPSQLADELEFSTGLRDERDKKFYAYLKNLTSMFPDKPLSEFAKGGTLDVPNLNDGDFVEAYAKGGIMMDGRLELGSAFGVGGNKSKTYKFIKDDRDSNGKPFYQVIESPSNVVMAEGEDFQEAYNMFKLFTKGSFEKGGSMARGGSTNYTKSGHLVNGKVIVAKHPQGHFLIIDEYSYQIGENFKTEQDAYSYARNEGMRIKGDSYAKGGSLGKSNIAYIDAIGSFGTDDDSWDLVTDILKKHNIEVNNNKDWHTKGYAEELYEDRDGKPIFTIKLNMNDSPHPKKLQKEISNLPSRINYQFSNDYAKGGIMMDGRLELGSAFGVGGNKSKTYKFIKDDRDSNGKPFYQVIESPSNSVMAEGEDFQEAYNMFKLFTKGSFEKGGSTYAEGGEIKVGDKIKAFISDRDGSHHIERIVKEIKEVNGKKQYVVKFGGNDRYFIMEDEIKSYAKGGRLDMELLDYNIGGALAVASQVKGVAPKSVDGIDSYIGNKFKNQQKMDDWWNTSPNERKARGYAGGGQSGMSQGYNDKDDESIGMRNRGNKMQSRKDRRDESARMEKSGGRRKYADVGTMDKGRRKKMEAGGGLGNIAKPFNIQEGMISVGNNVKFFKKGGGLYDNLKIKKGTFTKKAKNRGMTTKAFMKEVLSNPENYTMKTRRQAQLMKNMM